MMARVATLLTLIVGLPMAANSQSGVVRYDQATRLDIQLPPEMARNPQIMASIGNMPKNTVQPMQLRFTPEAALFGQAPPATEAGASGATRADVVMIGGGGGARGEMMVTREMGAEMMMMGRAMGFMGGGAGDVVGGAFTNLEDGSYVEVREFLGRKFRIPEERPEFAWKLTGEAAQFLGFPVYQAIATQDSTTLEAWFTPDIPVSAGPAQYGGLPGLILTLAVDSNRVVYTATAVDTTTPVGKIEVPSDGNKVTRAEYDKIVAEKQEEMTRARRGRRN
jgi:hypothetical protein